MSGKEAGDEADQKDEGGKLPHLGRMTEYFPFNRPSKVADGRRAGRMEKGQLFKYFYKIKILYLLY